MRPFPDTTIAPTAPGVHPLRPWWKAGTEFGTGWTRSDGWQVTDNGYHYYSSAPHDLDLDIDHKNPEGNSYLEVMATIDAEWPLPTPPLRAGQVWLLEARNACTLALLNSHVRAFITGQGPVTICWSLGEKGLTHSQAQEILLRSARYGINAFLVADPVDPMFTHWTGATGTGWPDAS